ncbi:MAG: cell division protein FtsA [Deltaproteobacteria bacterium]|nr:cell division protein FtsA [Deltaproteobacteria bacterium]
MPKRDELIVGLDIGTTKIAAIVGEVSDEGIDIIGIGTAPSRGLRKGVVTHIDHTVASIKRAIEEAELMAGCEISSVYAGIAGGHIKGFNSHGIVAVKDGEVRTSDVGRVIDAAKAVAIPMDKEIIHVLPQDFVVDGQDGIKEPLGMSGVRLEARVHIVTAAVTSAQNIVKCCQRCDLQVADLVLQPLASGHAVLHEDEMELGVALIDIGGGTTDITIFSEGSIVHTSVVAAGGNHITNDIAVGLRTPSIEAEKIKQRWGCAMTSMVDADEEIEVPSVGGRAPRRVPRRVLCEVIEPRVEEMFMLVQREVAKTGYEELLASGAVITGGTTIMEGMPELAEEVLGLPVRRGAPRGIGGLVDVVRSPKFATGVGLVLYGAKQLESAGAHRARPEKVSLGHRVKDWFSKVF